MYIMSFVSAVSLPFSSLHLYFNWTVYELDFLFADFEYDVGLAVGIRDRSGSPTAIEAW